MAEIALAGATSVLRQSIGVLSNLAIYEGSRLSRLREGILWIESEIRHIQSYLEDADVGAKQGRNRRVASLMTDIRDLAHDVENIIDTYFPRITSHRTKGIFWRLKNAFCILRYNCTVHNFVMEVERIKRRVENINRVRLTYGINEGSSRDGAGMWDARRTVVHVDEPYVVGFDKHIKELVTKLHNPYSLFDVISIVGMPGLGKTTLARNIFKAVTTHVANDSDNNHFEFSAWVYVSQQPNIKELLLNIARQMQLKIPPVKDGKDLGLDMRKRDADIEVKLEDIETEVFSFLSQKRFVIVLDDLWNTETWVAFKNAIPINSKNGSRIIVTSRYTSVGMHVGGRSSLHELQPLDQETSRELFFKMLMSNTTGRLDPPELENIARQLLKKCGGVPLAIVVIVGLLSTRDRTEHAWRAVLGSMGQDQDRCLEIFALSYNDLPTQLKPCFLYFGLFPEDHEIKVFELINLWVAEGFIKPSGTREVEDVGEDFLNHLIARNLIQVVHRRFDGRIRTCRIHDIFHDLCVRMSEEINFFKKHDNVSAGNSATRVRRVTAQIIRAKKHFIELLSQAHPISHRLEYLQLWAYGEEIDLSSTLDLSRYENLRKLSLGGYIFQLPGRDKLPPNLTKLTFKFTELVESPLEALKKHPKLKILKMGCRSYRRSKIICSGGLDNFPQLEALEIHDLPHLRELIVDEGAMPELKKLSIVRCKWLGKLPDRFRNITTVE